MLIWFWLQLVASCWEELLFGRISRFQLEITKTSAMATWQTIQRGDEPVTVDEADQASEEYQLGREAFQLGQPIEACMFAAKSGLQQIRDGRRRWMKGWLDARSECIHRKIWDRYGIKERVGNGFRK